jgi:hypothetical protein
MTPLACPGCGAAVKAPPNAAQYQCPYCQHTMQLEAPKPPPAAAPAQGQSPHVIVVHHNQSDYGSPVIYTGGGAWGTYWMIRMGIFVVVMICSAGGWGFRRWRGAHVASDIGDLGAGAGWDGTTPLSCGGNDQFDVTGITASFTAGTAISASGNCHVSCTNCSLKAPVAVEASGNGEVKLINGNITGTQSSLNATGNGNIYVLGNASVVGPFHQSGNGKVTGVTPPAAPPPVAAAAQPAAVAHPVAPPVVQHAPPPHMPPPTPAPTQRRR